MDVVLLDGPMGTELARRGVSTAGRAWSATAIDTAPEVIEAIHADYAAAGATIHTANTFRTTGRAYGMGWQRAARRAVALARGAVPAHHRIAGSIAPLEDCYRPDRAPPDAGAEHAQLAQVLADAGVDLLLCETFPHPGEALAAGRAALATGLPTWLALTAGPGADLLSPEAMADTAAIARAEGIELVLISCTPALRIAPWIDALAHTGAPFGVYANAGDRDGGLGWGRARQGPARYAALALDWARAGAVVIGGCCGTSVAHIEAVATALAAREPQRR